MMIMGMLGARAAVFRLGLGLGLDCLGDGIRIEGDRSRGFGSRFGRREQRGGLSYGARHGGLLKRWEGKTDT
jgi:hypothetical protein